MMTNETDVSQGDIVLYTVPDDGTVTGPSIAPGDVLPMIVVNVNADDGTYSGTVFTTDGATLYAHVAPAPEAPPEPVAPTPVTLASIVDADSPQQLSASVAGLTQTERDALRAALGDTPIPPPTTPPVADPAPAAATFSSGGATTLPPTTDAPVPAQNPGE